MDDLSVFKPGDIVLSKAGRDQGRYFVVMRCEENFCLLADGDLRKIDKMKRKKNKHIKWAKNRDGSWARSEFIANKLSANEKVTNSEVRRALAEFRAEQEGDE